MGTNYYVPAKPPCAACGHGSADLHIGKSAGGWRFMFHAYPEHGLTTWAAWQAYLADKEIKNEYGTPVSLEALAEKVESKLTGRHCASDRLDPDGHPFIAGDFS